MWCLIKLPNSVVFEVQVDPKAIGQQCLEKVCEIVDIRYESDYFGLKYENHRNEETWLNLRNPIDRQVDYHGNASQPVRLSLRVKFFVPPHILQQDSTRHQFYLHAKLNLMERRLTAADWDSIARLIAYAAQAEHGDFNELNPAKNVYTIAPTITPLATGEKPQNFVHMVMNNHRACRGMKSCSAEYWFLKEVSSFENFGEETFPVKNNNANTVFGVGPLGITIYSKDADKQLISFTNITSASSHKRTFKLEYLNIDSEAAELNIKLDSSHLASSLYRAVTEKHAFYSCETVRSAVTSQFIRDLKGTIVSMLFNEDSQLGKKYVFDIRRTCREVYDNARRKCYQETAAQEIVADNLDHNHNGDESKSSQEKLTRFLDAMTCKICMDNQIDAIILPCGHAVACTACASRCDRCPLCRSDITQAQKVFLPLELLMDQTG